MLQDPSMMQQQGGGGFNPYQAYMTSPSSFKNNPAGFFAGQMEGTSRSSFGGSLSSQISSEYAYMYESPVMAKAQAPSGMLSGISHKPIGQNATLANMHRDISMGIAGDALTGSAMSLGGGTMGGIAGGAAVGSVLGPVGTAIGGVVGGILGESAMQPIVDSMNRSSIGASSIQQNMMGLTTGMSSYGTGTGVNRKDARDMYGTMQDLAIEDGQMSTDEINAAFGQSIKSGTMQSGGDASEMKKKIKEIKDLAKTLGEVFGTSDISEIFDNLKKIKSTGMDSAGATSVSKAISSYANANNMNVTEALDQTMQKAMAYEGGANETKAGSLATTAAIQNISENLGLEGVDKTNVQASMQRVDAQLTDFTSTAAGKSIAQEYGYMNKNQADVLSVHRAVRKNAENNGRKFEDLTQEEYKAEEEKYSNLSDEKKQELFIDAKRSLNNLSKNEKIDEKNKAYSESDSSGKLAIITGQMTSGFKAKNATQLTSQESVIENQKENIRFLNETEGKVEAGPGMNAIHAGIAKDAYDIRTISSDKMDKAADKITKNRQKMDQNAQEALDNNNLSSYSKQISAGFHSVINDIGTALTPDSTATSQYSKSDMSKEAVSEKYSSMSVMEKAKYLDIKDQPKTFNTQNLFERMTGGDDGVALFENLKQTANNNGVDLFDGNIDNTKDAFNAAVGANIASQGVKVSRYDRVNEGNMTVDDGGEGIVNAKDKIDDNTDSMKSTSGRSSWTRKTRTNGRRESSVDWRKRVRETALGDNKDMFNQFVGGYDMQFLKKIDAQVNLATATNEGMKSAIDEGSSIIKEFKAADSIKNDEERATKTAELNEKYTGKDSTVFEQKVAKAYLSGTDPKDKVKKAKKAAIEQSAAAISFTSTSDKFDTLFGTDNARMSEDTIEKFGKMLMNKGADDDGSKALYNQAKDTLMSETGMKSDAADKFLKSKGKQMVAQRGVESVAYSSRKADIQKYANMGSGREDDILQSAEGTKALEKFQAMSMEDKIKTKKAIDSYKKNDGKDLFTKAKNLALEAKDGSTYSDTARTLAKFESKSIQEYSEISDGAQGAKVKKEFEAMAGRKLTDTQNKGLQRLSMMTVGTGMTGKDGKEIKRFMNQDELDALGSGDEDQKKLYKNITQMDADGKGIFNVNDIKRNAAIDSGEMDKSDAGLLGATTGQARSKTEQLLESIAKSNDSIDKKINEKEGEQKTEASKRETELPASGKDFFKLVDKTNADILKAETGRDPNATTKPKKETISEPEQKRRDQADEVSMKIHGKKIDWGNQEKDADPTKIVPFSKIEKKDPKVTLSSDGSNKPSGNISGTLVNATGGQGKKNTNSKWFSGTKGLLESSKPKKIVREKLVAPKPINDEQKKTVKQNELATKVGMKNIDNDHKREALKISSSNASDKEKAVMMKALDSRTSKRKEKFRTTQRAKLGKDMPLNNDKTPLEKAKSVLSHFTKLETTHKKTGKTRDLLADEKKIVAESIKAESTVKVKKGDTLSKIAKDNDTDIASLMKLNPSIKNANSIKVGQDIVTKSSAEPTESKRVGKDEIANIKEKKKAQRVNKSDIFSTKGSNNESLGDLGAQGFRNGNSLMAGMKVKSIKPEKTLKEAEVLTAKTNDKGEIEVASGPKEKLFTRKSRVSGDTDIDSKGFLERVKATGNKDMYEKAIKQRAHAGLGTKEEAEEAFSGMNKEDKEKAMAKFELKKSIRSDEEFKKDGAREIDLDSKSAEKILAEPSKTALDKNGVEQKVHNMTITSKGGDQTAHNFNQKISDVTGGKDSLPAKDTKTAAEKANDNSTKMIEILGKIEQNTQSNVKPTGTDYTAVS